LHEITPAELERELGRVQQPLSTIKPDRR